MPDTTTSEIECLIEESFDSLQVQLLDLAPYISSMPEEDTWALHSSSDKGTQDKDHLHYPSPEFFDLIIWNIVIPFWVSILTNSLYNKLFAGRTDLKSRNELKEIHKEVITNSKTEIKIGNLAVSFENTKRRSIELLTTYGVPESEASEKAEEINERLTEAVQRVEEAYSHRREEDMLSDVPLPIEV